ncbi:hypothetical protein HYV30_04175 [Candidatus Kaiserbacteria bacterium]|nr:hypothetical protein [Candidatus Kaiserbacteria bacterium]
MRACVNSYIGALLITIIGGGAALLIVRVATDVTLAETFGNRVMYGLEQPK